MGFSAFFSLSAKTSTRLHFLLAEDWFLSDSDFVFIFIFNSKRRREQQATAIMLQLEKKSRMAGRSSTMCRIAIFLIAKVSSFKLPNITGCSM